MPLLLIVLLSFFCISVWANTIGEDTKQHSLNIPTLAKKPERVKPEIMVDFRQPNEVDHWRITNDTVMGGKSTSAIVFTADHGTFKGHISLENNGGFSSIYRPIEPLSKALNTAAIDIQGDGHTYQLRMAVNIEGYRLTYKHDFNTIVGQRERITFKLADFQATFRGREVTNVPGLTAENISEVGFLITSKVPGHFALGIYQIIFFKA